MAKTRHFGSLMRGFLALGFIIGCVVGGSVVGTFWIWLG